jgi:hypothetical protein
VALQTVGNGWLLPDLVVASFLSHFLDLLFKIFPF